LREFEIFKYIALLRQLLISSSFTINSIPSRTSST
jgi:hypothetical protein